ncbi:MAG TPA: hypothetical protein VG651_08490 [Stellaceae bacterium]|nr:hypothetical protein [Stellaceae bacterium]
MTADELIAAFRTLSPSEQRRFLAELVVERQQARGRPSLSYDDRLERIARVEAAFGHYPTKEAAYAAIGGDKGADAVKTQYLRDMRWLDDWVDWHFEE